MKNRKRLVALALLGGLIVLGVVVSGRRDPRLEALVGGRVPIGEGAVETELAEAELVRYGPDLMPGLRAELRRGTWRNGPWASKLIGHLPEGIRHYFSRAEYTQDRRRGYAALCLGRIGSSAGPAVLELEAVAAAGGFHAAHEAEVALANGVRDASAGTRVRSLRILAEIGPPGRRGHPRPRALHQSPPGTDPPVGGRGPGGHPPGTSTLIPRAAILGDVGKTVARRIDLWSL